MNLYNVKVKGLTKHINTNNYDENLPFSKEPTKKDVIELLQLICPSFVPIDDCIDCIQIKYLRPLNEREL